MLWVFSRRRHTILQKYEAYCEQYGRDVDQRKVEGFIGGGLAGRPVHVCAVPIDMCDLLDNGRCVRITKG